MFWNETKIKLRQHSTFSKNTLKYVLAAIFFTNVLMYIFLPNLVKCSRYFQLLEHYFIYIVFRFFALFWTTVLKQFDLL